MNGVDWMTKGKQAGEKEPTDDNECKLTFKGKHCARWSYPDLKMSCIGPVTRLRPLQQLFEPNVNVDSEW